MHKLQKRLDAVQDFLRESRQQSEVIPITFVEPDGRETDAVTAEGPEDFICRRGHNESLDAFKRRAADECLAHAPFGAPLPLIFFGESADVS